MNEFKNFQNEKITERELRQIDRWYGEFCSMFLDFSVLVSDFRDNLNMLFVDENFDDIINVMYKCDSTILNRLKTDRKYNVDEVSKSLLDYSEEVNDTYFNFYHNLKPFKFEEDKISIPYYNFTQVLSIVSRDICKTLEKLVESGLNDMDEVYYFSNELSKTFNNVVQQFNNLFSSMLKTYEEDYKDNESSEMIRDLMKNHITKSGKQFYKWFQDETMKIIGCDEDEDE